MVKLEVNSKGRAIMCDGHLKDLILELAIGCGDVLQHILKETPQPKN